MAYFIRPSYDSSTGHFHVRYTHLGDRLRDNVNAIGFIRDDNRREIDSAAEKVSDEIERVFTPEFLNRVDETIVFHQLRREQIDHIVEIQLERVRCLLHERNLGLEVSDAARQVLADRGYDPHYGARPLKRVIQRLVQDPLAMRILEGDFPEGSLVRVDADDGGELAFRKA
jgi:ATP-dependent Clp protease ATP-binding subunit ClpB